MSHLPLLARSAPTLLPMLVRQPLRNHKLPWVEVKLMIYLNEWSRFLERSRQREGATILDQGPVYSLARLDTLDLPLTETRRFADWNARVTTLWSARLDVIVTLDARDDVLQQRIDSRDQAHATKGASRETTRSFLAEYRRSYERTLGRMAGPGSPTVLSFDTSSRLPAEMAPEVLESLWRSR